MKNRIFVMLLFFAPGSMLNAMEKKADEPITQERPVAELGTVGNWQHLPTEIKYKILSFVPAIENFEDWLNAIRVNQEFKTLATDQYFLNDFAKRIAEHQPDRATQLLKEAAKHGNVSLTKALREADDSLSKQAEDLLFTAARTGNLATIKKLIEAGVNINAANEAHRTALHLALIYSFPLLAQWLISNGTDVNKKDKNDTTPLMLAVKLNDLNIIQQLLNKKAAINARDNTGQTALMIASTLGRQKVAKILISNKANATLKDNAGHTAYTLAFYKRHKKIANLLKKPRRLPTILEEKLKSFLLFI